MARQLSKQKEDRALLLASGLEYDPANYKFDSAFKPSSPHDPMSAHTTAEMIECMRVNPKIELDAKIIASNGNVRTLMNMNRESFVQAYLKDSATKLKEADGFYSDPMDFGAGGSGFIPLMGGPFYKNLYFYSDYIRMHSAAFYAYHNDPAGKAIADMTRDFTVGRGFRVDSDNKVALAIWRAFEKVNQLNSMMQYLSLELCIYGEHMIWWLPNRETKIVYKPGPNDPIPVGIIPRVQLVDPSNIVEIITMPESIQRRLAYVWMAPTQYQIYGTPTDDPKLSQPALKFIYRQIPADEMMHYKVNGVSNEKRGRSDYFGAIGYMQRLTSAVDFVMQSHNKQSAWSIDTTITGSPEDISRYSQQLQSLGKNVRPGSEFVHSDKVKREFLANSAGKSGQNESFEWCLSMIAMNVGIPVNYFSTHLSGGQTRASAVVATEPVAKKWEMRQQILETVIKELWDKLMLEVGLSAECEVTFPDIITADRSQKLKDLEVAQMNGWISKRRAATIAAREFNLTDFEYDAEQNDITQDREMSGEVEPESFESPLFAPAMSNMTSQDKATIKNQNRY